MVYPREFRSEFPYTPKNSEGKIRWTPREFRGPQQRGLIILNAKAHYTVQWYVLIYFAFNHTALGHYDAVLIHDQELTYPAFLEQAAQILKPIMQNFQPLINTADLVSTWCKE